MIFCSSFITIASASKRFGELLILGDFFLCDIFLGDNLLGDIFLGEFLFGDNFLGDIFLGEFLFGEGFRLDVLFLISCPFLS